MVVEISEIINLVEAFAPPYLAADWDRVGLQLGDPEAKTKKLLITLDVLPEVVEEARAGGADLILSHHPVIREGIPDLTVADPAGRVLLQAARTGISIFVAHTNLDKTRGGVSDVLAEELGLKEVEVLCAEEEVDTYKLAVFVPEESTTQVIRAVSEAGAGVIGNYTYCTFRSPGIGTFKPGAGAEPAVGKVEELNEVKEYKLEMAVSGEKLASVVAAMIAAHPYEEVAYDLYQRRNPSLGFGRIGILEEGLSLSDCVARWKEKLGIEVLRVIGSSEQRVKRVAVCAGGGGALIGQAKARGAEVYLTGDVKYHEAQLAKSINLALIDAGHYDTEKVILPRLASLVDKSGIDVEVMISQTVTDPWKKGNR